MPTFAIAASLAIASATTPLAACGKKAAGPPAAASDKDAPATAEAAAPDAAAQPSKPSPPADDAGKKATTTPDASATAPAEDVVSTPSAADNAEPLFGSGDIEPHPVAKRACDAIYGVGSRAKSACCPGVDDRGMSLLVGQCERALTVGLRDGTIAIAPASLEACEKAAKTAFDGCDWVSPVRPAPPQACTRIVTGKRAAQDPCRGSSECATGLFCAGVSATKAGVCLAPAATGSRCGTWPDVLGNLARQDNVVDHPPCEGYCKKRVCADRVALGKACTLNDECGPEARCKDNKCVKGAQAKAGDVCGPGNPCGRGLYCATAAKPKGKRVCKAPKKAGEPCSTHFECRGGCVGPADNPDERVCGKRCTAGAIKLEAPGPPRPKPR